MIRTCLEFVKEDGERVMQAWLEEMKLDTRERVRAAIDNRLIYLQATKDPGRPLVAPLTGGDCQGLFEMRFRIQRVQYRPIFFYGPGPGELTLLAGAIEKGGDLRPRSVCLIAQRRKALAMEDRRCVREYFS